VTDERAEAVRRLDALVGRWQVIVEGDFAPEPVLGTMTCEWQEGRFLVQRTEAEHADMPASIVMIGVDDTNGTGTALYTDNRGVHRIYATSLADGVWRQSREAPGFSQRFTGEFDGPDTIRGRWETCTDGQTWAHDFNMTFVRQS